MGFNSGFKGLKCFEMCLKFNILVHGTPLVSAVQKNKRKTAVEENCLCRL